MNLVEIRKLKLLKGVHRWIVPAELLVCAAEGMDGYDDEEDGENDAEEAELRSRLAKTGPARAGPVGSISAQASTRRPVSSIPPRPPPARGTLSRVMINVSPRRLRME